MDTTKTNTNRALWQDKPGIPGSVRDSPFPRPLDTDNTNTTNKILIRVQAWAINPCDHMLQDRDLGLSAAASSSSYYPLILGCDVAGVVVGVFPSHPPTSHSASTSTSTFTTGSQSESQSRFQIGDRVFGMTPNRGFQDHVLLEERLAAKIPSDNDKITFAEAVVFGLCSQTAAMLLFGSGFLGLDSPVLIGHQTAPGDANSEIGIGNGNENGNGGNKKTLLIWGGASAVGSNAIQLASAAG
jgi:NADPH:quinone reductase-like Zn-dependent oxidoreductase